MAVVGLTPSRAGRMAAMGGPSTSRAAVAVMVVVVAATAASKAVATAASKAVEDTGASRVVDMVAAVVVTVVHLRVEAMAGPPRVEVMAALRGAMGVRVDMAVARASGS